MKVGAVLVAAGRGERLGDQLPKALVGVAGRTLLEHALDRIRGAGPDQVVVVHTPGWRDAFAEQAAGALLVEGGASRTDSVRAGVRALDERIEVVAVHDAARALTPVEVIVAVLEAVTGDVVAAAPALPIPDTLKRVSHGQVLDTVDRSGLVAVQTPQAFPREVLVQALAGGAATDDLALVERQIAAGTVTGRVVVVPGSPLGLKVTWPHDLVTAETLQGAGP